MCSPRSRTEILLQDLRFTQYGNGPFTQKGGSSKTHLPRNVELPNRICECTYSILGKHEHRHYQRDRFLNSVHADVSNLTLGNLRVRKQLMLNLRVHRQALLVLIITIMLHIREIHTCSYMKVLMKKAWVVLPFLAQPV